MTRYPAVTAHDDPERDRTVLALFDAALAAHPDAPLTSFFDATLTYAEVDAFSDALCRHWQDAGLVMGDRVAIQLQNVPQFVIAVVAIWKFGGALVALNPMYLAKEVHTALLDSGARAFVGSTSNWDDVVVPALDGTALESVLCTDELELQARNDPRLPVRAPGSTSSARATSGIDLMTIVREGARSTPRHAPLALSRPLIADDLAMLCYTSGTSGLPKAAILTHRNIVAGAQGMQTWAHLPHAVKIFALAPYCHITGLVCQIVLPILQAGSTVMTLRFHSAVTLDAIREHRPQFMTGTATAYLALLADPSVSRDDFDSFQLLATGGMAMPTSVFTRMKALTGHDIHNGYGMTETAAACASVPIGVTPPADPDSGVVSSGTPYAGTTFFILDANGDEITDGSVGELAVTGEGVVAGYWNRPTETAATFSRGRLLTGDIGRLDHNGWLFVLDRTKEMINASGFKVSPREVEDVLYRHPSVFECGVFGIPDDYRGESVNACVSLKAGATFNEAELIDHCRQHLAAFKVPSRIFLTASIPKNNTGKILRRELKTLVP